MSHHKIENHEEHVKNLQSHLEENPGIQKVHFNEKGHWLFHDHPEFPIEKSRDEVMRKEFAVKPKESRQATDLLDVTGAKLKTTTEKSQEEEADSDVIPIKDKVANPSLATSHKDISVTEIEGDNQVIVDQPVIPHEATPHAPKSSHKKK